MLNLLKRKNKSLNLEFPSNKIRVSFLNDFDIVEDINSKNKSLVFALNFISKKTFLKEVYINFSEEFINNGSIIKRELVDDSGLCIIGDDASVMSFKERHFNNEDFARNIFNLIVEKRKEKSLFILSLLKLGYNVVIVSSQEGNNIFECELVKTGVSLKSVKIKF